MAEVASAYVTLLPSAKGFGPATSKALGQDMDKVGRDGGKRMAGGMKSSVGSLAKGVVAPLAGAFAAVQVGSFFKGAIDEARESQKVGAITANVIKTTGGAANVTAGDVRKLATAISNKTAIDDEAIQSASNLLLTFTNVRNEVGKGNDVFNQATQIATDMGAALGTEPKAAAIQLGKALNDPVKGITALSRVGVSFTEEQKKQIATLVKHKDTLGAQKIILGELNKEFGGTAAASATAGEKLSVTFDNFKESIGTALLPVLDSVENFISSSLLPTLSSLGGFLISTLAPGFKFISDVITTFFNALRGEGDDAFFFTNPALSAGISSFADMVRSAIGGLSTLPKKFAPLIGAVKSFALAVFAAGRQALPALISIGKALLPFVKLAIGVAIVTIVVAFKALAPVVRVAGAALGKVGDFAREHTTTFRGLAVLLASLFIPTLITMGVQATLSAARVVAAWVAMNLMGIKAIATQALAAASVVAGWVLMGVQALLNAAKIAAAWLISLGPIGLVVAAVAAAVVLVIKYWGKIKSAAAALADKVGDAFHAVVGFVSGAVDKITGFLSNWGLLFLGPIGAVIKFRDKISSVIDSIVGFFTKLPGRITSAAKGAFDGLSSAFKTAVNFIIDGWNSLEFHIPGFDPPGPGPKFGGFTLGVPDIPRLATGGLITRRGLALVGEDGPELLSLPRGAVVSPDVGDIRGGDGAAAPTVIINNPVPEPASESVPRALRELQFTHGFAW